MPVDTAIVWDLEDWVAWSEVPFEEVLVRSGSAPPSRFRASWILVSLVSRAMVALRTGLGFVEDIVGSGEGGCVALDSEEEVLWRCCVKVSDYTDVHVQAHWLKILADDAKL